MNKKNLSLVFEKYIENFDYLIEPETHNETYKWKAVQHFQKEWNIDAENFADMFKKSMSEKSNLLDNSAVYPNSGILSILSKEGETEYIRQCFVNLFEKDNGDLEARQNRLETFIERINEKIDEYAIGNRSYQTMNSAICYLNFMYPEENYFYKASEAKDWANCMEFAEDFGLGENFSLKKYYKMCNELLAEINKNQELKKIHLSRFEKIKDHYIIEDEFQALDNILVYDIIYCAHNYNFYSKAVIATTSTKERIRRAELNLRCEDINSKIAEAEARCSEILAEGSDNMDLIGKVVMHKMFKEGTVVSQTDEFLEISFPSGVKKLQFPFVLVKGFLKFDDDDVMAFAIRKNELNSEYQKLQKTIEELTRELEKTKKELN